MPNCHYCKGKIEHLWVKVHGKYYHHDCFDKNLGKLLGISKTDEELIEKVVNYV